MGRGRRAYLTFAALWLAVFAIQTAVLLSGSDSVRNRRTGAWDPAYFPVVLAIFLAGCAIVALGSLVRDRRRR